MVIKYYGSSKVDQYVGWSACHPVISKLYATNPYKYWGGSPSCSVMIVPGTVDCNGDDITFGKVND